jgi:hypothetical protein
MTEDKLATTFHSSEKEEAEEEEEEAEEDGERDRRRPLRRFFWPLATCWALKGQEGKSWSNKTRG